MHPERPVVIVSNRGPVSFQHDNGRLVARRGAGGLVTGLAPIVAGTDAIWLAAALSDADREAAAQGVADADGLRVRMVDFDAGAHRMAYDVVCNATLWFCLHGLFDLARRPRIDHRWREAWEAYRSMNEAFADAAAEIAPDGAAVLVQDYHLALMGPRLRALRPDLRTVHFSHTPWCDPDGLRPLPDDVAAQFVGGIAGHHASTFHTRRWASAFETSCRAVLGTEAKPSVGVTPLAPDPDDLAAAGASAECAAASQELRDAVGDRKLLVRVDRIELSKNVLRGFHAFDDLLERYPEWRQRVVFAAFLYPSREGLAEYLAYRQEAEGLVARLNDKWATADWTPIHMKTSDDYPRSMAALQLADVVLVNPIRDGLNLVAMEGVLASRHASALVLSTEAGAWEQLGDAGAIGINPFDVGATAEALHAALSMTGDEREKRHAALRAVVAARTPADWLREQLAAAG
ncbi:MAG: trehalose 6-phosphate synthase [Acidimicrobiaceae bacterium]